MGICDSVRVRCYWLQAPIMGLWRAEGDVQWATNRPQRKEIPQFHHRRPDTGLCQVVNFRVNFREVVCAVMSCRSDLHRTASKEKRTEYER